jgi:S1-C subfamily serine protease
MTMTDRVGSCSLPRPRWLVACSAGLLVLASIACTKDNNKSANSIANGQVRSAVAGAVASATVFSGAASSRSTGQAGAASGASGQGSAASASAAGGPVEQVVQAMQASVVRITASSQAVQRSPFGPAGGASQAQGVGTGMVLDDQGHILTNNHVVTLESSSPAQSLTVDLPTGKTVPATLVGTDPLTDLAVIQVGSGDRSSLKPIQWANPTSIAVGEGSVAIGYALDLGGAPTVTVGVVSATKRTIPETDATISGAIQTDTAINPGNSGGPLLDLSGKVIGVNTAGLVGSPQQPAQGINFAVSVETAQPVSQALISQGRVTRGFLGVSVTDITPQLAKSANLGVNQGAGVEQVTPGSPAAQAGLQPGDVITKVGDTPIADTGDLTIALTKNGPGTKVTVVYNRNGSQQTADVTLGQRPTTP